MGLLFFVACNSDPSPGSSLLPETNSEVKRIVLIGINSALDAMEKYDYYGSYSGMTKSLGTDTVVYHYSHVVDNVDLSMVDTSLGTKTVTMSGQVSFKFDNLPSSYPCTIEYNISFEIMGSSHTLEQRKKSTGVSSQTVSYLKVDGVQYNPY